MKEKKKKKKKEAKPDENQFVFKLVVCLSTNGERALNYTIVKRLILITKTQATKIKSSL